MTTRSTCPWCHGAAVTGSTCPWALECPDCGSGRGKPCKRPSGHVAAKMHASRWEAAEALDETNGVTYS